MAEAILASRGIYAIRNIGNGKVYVGSTVNFRTRKATHFNRLRKAIHTNSILQRAWDKHGERAFLFEILEVVEDKFALVMREQYWIDKFRVCRLRDRVQHCADRW